MENLEVKYGHIVPYLIQNIRLLIQTVCLSDLLIVYLTTLLQLSSLCDTENYV
jgi:hypothetical protein